MPDLDPPAGAYSHKLRIQTIVGKEILDFRIGRDHGLGFVELIVGLLAPDLDLAAPGDDDHAVVRVEVARGVAGAGGGKQLLASEHL